MMKVQVKVPWENKMQKEKTTKMDITFSNRFFAADGQREKSQV